MSSTPTPNNNGGKGGDNSLSLIHAMRCADAIRKIYDAPADSSSSNNSNASPVGIPPGTAQGISAFLITGIALFPLRRVILNSAGGGGNHKPFQHFVDIVISVGHALASTQVGLYIGSLYGSQTYLDLLKKEPPTSNSPLTDKVCQKIWSDILPKNYYHSPSNFPSSSQQFDPRAQTMTALQEAIESCLRRKEFQQSTNI